MSDTCYSASYMSTRPEALYNLGSEADTVSSFKRKLKNHFFYVL